MSERQRKLARERQDNIHAITHGLIEIKRKLAAAGLQVALQDTGIQDRIAKPKLVRVIVVVTGVSLAGILFGQSDTMALGDGGPLYGRNLSSYSARGVVDADSSEQHRRRGPHLKDSSGLDERKTRDHSDQGLRQWRIAPGLNGYWPERLISPANGDRRRVSATTHIAERRASMENGIPKTEGKHVDLGWQYSNLLGNGCFIASFISGTQLTQLLHQLLVPHMPPLWRYWSRVTFGCIAPTRHNEATSVGTV